MSTEKRKRDPVFQPTEKSQLVDLVAKYYSVVECKKTDQVSVKMKCEKWKIIAEEFNSTTSLCNREWKVLRNLWENLKKKAKQTITIQNQNNFGTGGGPLRDPKSDEIINRIIPLIRPNVEGLSNEFDSDSINIEENCTDKSFCIEEYEDEPEDWTNYQPSMLKKRKSSPLRSVNDENIIIKFIDCEDQNVSGGNPSSTNSNSNATPYGSKTSSRRRPVLPEKENTLLKTKLKTLETANEQALEEHSIKVRILLLQEEQEKEKLEQEKLKTLILKRNYEQVL